MAAAPRWPDFPSLSMQDPLAVGRVFHTMDAIDFDALRGRHIAVLGAGASAFDNAACALEAGAAVSQFARRAVLPQINKSKAASFPAFCAVTRHWTMHANGAFTPTSSTSRCLRPGKPCAAAAPTTASRCAWAAAGRMCSPWPTAWP
jgi:cation diffusion facilitator CzcD-associated flavoprotein CzcO